MSIPTEIFSSDPFASERQEDDEILSMDSGHSSNSSEASGTMGITRPMYTSPNNNIDFSPVFSQRKDNQQMQNGLFSMATTSASAVNDPSVSPTSPSALANSSFRAPTISPDSLNASLKKSFDNSFGLEDDSHFPQYLASPPESLSLDLNDDRDSVSRLLSPETAAEYASLRQSYFAPGRTRSHVKETGLRTLGGPLTSNPDGIGITPPPRKNSNRIIVPSIKPSRTHKYTVFVLVIKPANKIFELISVEYSPDTTTIGDLMQLIPSNVTDNELRTQVHVGICRPRASSSASREFCNLQMTASAMMRDGSDARIQCGEVLVAIPKGFNGKECQILSRHILKMPNMKKLISGEVSLENKRNKKKKSLGITSREHDSMASEGKRVRDSFSSSILFSPEANKIMEDPNAAKEPVTNRLLGSDQKTQTVTSVKSDACTDFEQKAQEVETEVDVCGVVKYGTKKGEHVSKLVSEIEAKTPVKKLQDKNRGIPRLSLSQSRSGDDGNNSIFNHTTISSNTGLSGEQLDVIRHEAAAAAKAAAAVVFQEKINELMEKMNISQEEREILNHDSRLVNDFDDMSFYSAFSITGTPRRSTGKPQTRFDSCAFPTSIQMSAVTTPNQVNMSTLTSSTTPIASTQYFLPPNLPLPQVSSQSRTVECSSPVPVDPLEISTSDTKNSGPNLFMIDEKVALESESLSELYLVETAMKDAYETMVKTVTHFLEKRQVKLRQLKGKLMSKQNTTRNVIKVVSFLFLVTILTYEKDGESADETKLDKEADKDVHGSDSFQLMDLQLMLFLLLLLAKGQDMFTKCRSKRRKRRSFTSRLRPIKSL